MVSCQKGPTRHAYAWQIGPFWQDTLDIRNDNIYHVNIEAYPFFLKYVSFIQATFQFAISISITMA